MAAYFQKGIGMQFKDNKGILDGHVHLFLSASSHISPTKIIHQVDPKQLKRQCDECFILIGNAGGNILFINSRIEEWFGYTRKELIGKPLACLIPGQFRVQQTDERVDFVLTPHCESMEHEPEFQGRGKNGRTIPLQISLESMGKENNEATLVTMTIITERKRDRETIRRSTAALHEVNRNKTITDNASTSLLMLDTFGRVTFANPATEVVMGYTPDELIGKVFHQVVHHTHQDGTPFPMGECPIIGILPLNHVLRNYEDVFIHKDGHFYPVRCNARQIFKQEVRVGIVLEILDITDLQRAEKDRQFFTLELVRQVHDRTDELVNSQKRLREMAADLNLTEQRERQRIAMELHDYLSQLLVVCRLKLTQTMQVLKPETQELNLIKETDDILDQALTYSRTLVAELSPSVLFEFGLLAALKWLAGQMIHHGLNVTMTCAGIQDLNVPEDKAILLYQSTRELFFNVMKHAGTNRATLTLGKEEGVLRITVGDEGKGFHSTKGTATPFTEQSMKFGLFSIRERMISLGGSFAIESQPTHGTLATLLLPLSLKGEIHSGLHQDPPGSSPSTSSSLRATL
jgi:PAS domain S-box-containing protein